MVNNRLTMVLLRRIPIGLMVFFWDWDITRSVAYPSIQLYYNKLLVFALGLAFFEREKKIGKSNVLGDFKPLSPEEN